MEKTNNVVIVKGVRLSYAHLVKPYAFEEGDDKQYSARILVPTDSEAHTTLSTALSDFANNPTTWEKANGGKVPTHFDVAIYDGDEDDEVEKGMHYVNARSKYKPEVIDLQGEVLESEEDIYSGMFANVELIMYAYKFNKKFGVAFGLGHIQKTEDGEKLSTRKSASEVFGIGE